MKRLPDRATMVVEVDSMLDAWRIAGGAHHPEQVAPDAHNGVRGEPKPPAIYAVGIVDYANIARIDPDGADRLLGEVSWRLDRLVRSGDMLGHVAPGTFLLAATEMEPATAGSVMDRIRGALAMPVEIGGGPVSLNVAIGVAFAFDDESAENLVCQAERDLDRVLDA